MSSWSVSHRFYRFFYILSFCPAHITLRVEDLTSDLKILDSDVVGGTVKTGLDFITALVRARGYNDTLLWDVIRVLEFVKDRTTAQACCRVATSIFNQWQSLEHGNFFSFCQNSQIRLRVNFCGMKEILFCTW